MYLTPNQIKELFDVIDTFSLKFAVQNISDKYLTPAEKKRLLEAGINPKTITPTVDNAFKFGMISEALGDEAKTMSFDLLRKKLLSKQFLPLDIREQQALESLRYEAYSEIRGLGNKINIDTQRIQVEVDKAQRLKYEKVIRDAAKKTIVDRGSVKQMSSLIGHKTGDWARDLDRISDFVLHNAHDMGRAKQIKRAHGAKAEVYKMVFDQACKTCVGLYLTNGVGSQPKVFKIDTLIANGSNIGRKQKDWKPVIGATHPWCFSDDTEVLTSRGWLLFKDVVGSDKILSVNLETENAEWININKKIEYHYKGDLWRYNNISYDVLCTPNHRHPIKFYKRKDRSGERYDKWSLVSGEDLPKSKFKFLRTIPKWKGHGKGSFTFNELRISIADYCEFMGYYLSEGNVSKKSNKWQIKITQQKTKNYNTIKSCCERIFDKIWLGEEAIYIPLEGSEFAEHLKKFGYSNEKYVPYDIKCLDVYLINVFLDAYLLGDGTVKKGNIWKGYQFGDEKKYYTSSIKMAADLGELILKVGNVPTYFEQKPKLTKHKNGEYTSNYSVWHITQKKNQSASMDRMNLDIVKYDGFVFCLELEKYNTLFVRRNGKVTLSGNCRCQLESLPKGDWEWNADKQKFDMKLTDREEAIRKKIKFKITIED